jgi:protein involved in polysaccharide export with SLBB domain
MTSQARRYCSAILSAGFLVATSLGLVPSRQEPAPKSGTAIPPRPAADDGPAKTYDPVKAVEAIKPLPLEPIPDNPPPHEGALFELSYRIHPPDLVLVEVLEALPGRAISGERLVRPDGTISLQWYGDVHVAGLTLEQFKEKLILHLRQYLTEESLGLILWREGPPLSPLPPAGTVVEGLLPPVDADQPAEQPPLPPNPNGARRPSDPFDLPQIVQPPRPGPVPDGVVAREFPSARFGNASKPGPLVAPSQEKAETKQPEANATVQRPMPHEQHPNGGRYVRVDPVASQRVFVDVTAYNNAVYYVQGDVAAPGRLPFTGRETVLDALIFGGGLLPSADEGAIRLYRPARGTQPAREYPIHLKAIHRGDNKANLQIFLGDRLIIPRKDANVRLGGRPGE